jgi:hypothetical protein
MANWKKVIVSGSNAHLNHITASGNISASGFLFGNLPASDLNQVVIYNSGSGRLEFKTLNLINTSPAPGLFIGDQSSPNYNNTHFRLSHDPGNTSLQSSNIFPYLALSASYQIDGTEYTLDRGTNLGSMITLNGEWTDIDLSDSTTYYTPSSNLTASFRAGNTRRDGLDAGQETAVARTFDFQSIDGSNSAVPSFDSTQANLNYGNKAFKDGGNGELRFFVNNNITPVRTFTLGGANSGVVSNNTANNITINLFATQSNLDSTTGDPDPARHYRSGSFTIGTGGQQDGYNYCYVLHTGSVDGNDFAHITQFSEWFYDFVGASDATDIEIKSGTTPGVTSNPVVEGLDANATHSISGIKFFNTPQDAARVTYTASISNQYRNVYPTSNGITFSNVNGNTISHIEVTQSGQYQTLTKQSQVVGTGNQTETFTLAALQDTAGANTTDTHITASIRVSFDPVGVQFYQPSGFIDSFTSDAIEGNSNIIEFTPNFTHITDHKASLALSEVSLGDYMLNQLTSGSTEANFEDFKGEKYRIQSRSYLTTDSPANPDNAAYAWDGEKNIVNGGAGFNQNAIQYYSHLLYPTGAGIGGTFNPSLGPNESMGQPTNYDDGSATGIREYFRYFKLTSGGAKQVTIELVGSGSVVTNGHTATFGAGANNAIKMQVNRTGNSSAYTGVFRDVFSTLDSIGTPMYDSINSPMGDGDILKIAPTTSDISYAANYEVASGVFQPTGVVKFSATDGGIFSVGDIIVVRIIVPENWKGHLDAMSLRTGASSATLLGTSGYTPL